MTKLDWRRVGGSIRHGSRYWFARLIVGASSAEASQFSRHVNAATRFIHHGLGMKKRYWRKRETGLTGVQIAAREHHLTIPEYRAYRRRLDKKTRERWGGCHKKVGSLAWRRALFARSLVGEQLTRRSRIPDWAAAAAWEAFPSA